MSERIPAGGPFRALSGMHEPLMLESIREARRMLSTYCQQPEPFCGPFVELVSRTAERVAKLRVEDLLDARDYKGVDLLFLESLRSLIRVYAEYIAGFYVTWNEYVVAQFLTDTEIDGFIYERGEIALLPLHQAALLAVAGVVRLFKSTAFMK